MTFIEVKPKKLLDIMTELGFKEVNTKSEYEKLRFFGDCSVVLFNTGKLILQGTNVKTTEKKLIEHGFHKQTFKETKGTIIGSDESLKGDTFGGIVVAAVKADEKTRKKLEEIGVKDSKVLNDAKIASLALKIKYLCPYSLRIIFPEEYNKHRSTTLLNKLHFEVAKELASKDTIHVVDKFPGCNVGQIAEIKAESKYIEVAAASIIARNEGINQIEHLSKELNIEIPRGSTHVKEALEALRKSGKPKEKFVKLHFRNV